MLSDAERQGFLKALRDDAQFRADVRKELLTDELLNLPAVVEQLASTLASLTAAVEHLTHSVDERFDAVDERFDAVDERFDRIDERFDAVDRRLDRVDADLGWVQGHQLEGELKARPRQVLRGFGAEVSRVRRLDGDELFELEHTLGLSNAEGVRLNATDLVAVVPAEDGTPGGYVVVEASWRTGSEDVERVVATRDIVRRTGLPVTAIVLDEAGLAHPSIEEQIRSQQVRHLSRVATS